MNDYSSAMRYATAGITVLGLFLNIYAIVLATRYKKDDKFCRVLHYATLIGNCILLGIVTTSTSRVEMEGHIIVYFNYGLCCLFPDRVCNVVGALVLQGMVFFPLMIITTLLFRALLALGYRYKVSAAGVVILVVYLLTLPRFVLHLTNFSEPIDVARELSHRLNEESRRASSYSIRLDPIMVISEIIYGFVPLFVVIACIVIGTVTMWKLSSDWDSYGSRPRRFFNGLLTATVFDCFFISAPYFLIEMDLIGKMWPASTQLYFLYFRQHLVALSWAAHGLIMLMFVPYMRRYFLEKLVDFLKEADIIEIKLSDSDNED